MCMMMPNKASMVMTAPNVSDARNSSTRSNNFILFILPVNFNIANFS